MSTSRSRGASAGACACALVLLAFSPQAAAQAENQAAARSLFDEGRVLMKSGQYAAACPKFEAANRLYTSAGIVLNLADCYEKTGRTASAWTEFGEAAAVATRLNRAEDATEAKQRQAAIEPKLMRLAIRAPSAIAGLVVKRDGTELAAAAWGTAIPVDPGPHTVDAQAPGRAPWTTTVTAQQPGQTMTVDVPDLGPGEVASAKAQIVAGQSGPSAARSSSGDADRGRTQRIVGWTVGGVGLVGAGVGGVLGLVAKSKYNTAAGETGPARQTDSQSAVNTGNVATVVFCVGAAALAAGVVVWLTAPHAAAAVGTNGSEVFVRTRF